SVGRPASSSMRAIITPPDTEVRGSGLSNTALPKPSAGTTERMDKINGKVNGEITDTTPAGRRRALDHRGSSVRSTSPIGAVHSAAASSHSLTATWSLRTALEEMARVYTLLHACI